MPAAPGVDWRRLPPLQRQQVLDAVRAKYPERYRDLVEQYFKSLQDSAER